MKKLLLVAKFIHVMYHKNQLIILGHVETIRGQHEQMEKEIERLKTEVIAKLVQEHEQKKQEFESLV